MSEYGSYHAISSIDVKHPNGILTYSSEGSLNYKGHYYNKLVADYLPLLEPLKTKSGSIAKRQPQKPRSQPATWWKAQCIFRGLNAKGSTADLQNNLRGHEGDPVCGDMVRLQEAAKKDFEIKDAQQKDYNWLHTLSDDQKAHKDPERYLEEKFKEGGKSKETVQFRANGTIWVHELARELGLECLTTAEPKKSEWDVISYDLAIVGQDKKAVEARAGEGAEAAERKKEKERQSALAKCKDWDVTGTWNIDCPDIMEQWPAEQLTMEIFIKNTNRGSQMFAKFNFGVIEGVMRFEKQVTKTIGSTQKTSVKSAPVSGKKRPREDDSEGEEEEEEESDEYDDERRSPTPEAFYLGPISQPTAKHSTWNYRYRASETGEGEIQLDEDENLYEISFLGPKGRTLEGEIGASLFKECTFTGVKVEPGGRADFDVGDLWANHNEAAHESAGVSRWHKPHF